MKVLSPPSRVSRFVALSATSTPSAHVFEAQVKSTAQSVKEVAGC